MAKWFGAHYNQEVRFSSAVYLMKGSQVLTSLLNQRRNYYYYLSNSASIGQDFVMGADASKGLMVLTGFWPHHNNLAKKLGYFVTHK